jgi:hypothetical protein
VLDGARLGDDRPELDAIDQGFAEGNVFDARVVKAVHVFPDCESAVYSCSMLTVDLLLFVVLVLDGSEEDSGLVGEEETAGSLCVSVLHL